MSVELAPDLLPGAGLQSLVERPLVTWTFVIVSAALAALAANRGYELSPAGSAWQPPAAVAGLLALMMPWAMAFTLHFAVESLPEAFSGFMAIGVGIARAVGVVGLRWILPAAILFAIGIGLGVCAVIPCALLIYACIALLIGDAARSIYHFLHAGPETGTFNARRRELAIE